MAGKHVYRLVISFWNRHSEGAELDFWINRIKSEIRLSNDGDIEEQYNSIEILKSMLQPGDDIVCEKNGKITFEQHKRNINLRPAVE